jgi:hypothetical protein
MNIGQLKNILQSHYLRKYEIRNQVCPIRNNQLLPRQECNFLSGLLMFPKPKHPSYIAYLIACFRFVDTKHDSPTRKNEAVVQTLSQLACLHNSFLLTNSLKKQIFARWGS